MIKPGSYILLKSHFQAYYDDLENYVIDIRVNDWSKVY